MIDRKLNIDLRLYIYCDNHVKISLNTKINTIFRLNDNLMFIHMTKVKVLY